MCVPDIFRMNWDVEWMGAICMLFFVVRKGTTNTAVGFIVVVLVP